MVKKTLVMSEDGMFASEPLSFADILQLACSCVASAAKSLISQAENDEEAQAIEKELFDTANVTFSQCLDFAFPNQELHPDLTEEAILRAENDILTERAAEIEPDAGEPEKIIPFPVNGGHVSDPEDVMSEKGE
jgi:hypothetical protein